MKGWVDFFPFLLRSYFFGRFLFFFLPLGVGGIFGVGHDRGISFMLFKRVFFLGWNGQRGGLVEGEGDAPKILQNVLNY